MIRNGPTRPQLRAADCTSCLERRGRCSQCHGACLAEMRPILVGGAKRAPGIRGYTSALGADLLYSTTGEGNRHVPGASEKAGGITSCHTDAALFGIADAHVQLRTPEAGDDVIEQFIDHHASDPDLPLLFEKLDSLYRAEHKPSRNELEKWVRRPEEPRRTFARWYLARAEFETDAGNEPGNYFRPAKSDRMQQTRIVKLRSLIEIRSSTFIIEQTCSKRPCSSIAGI